MRDLLAGYIETQVEWREAKAEEYPEDARNARSSTALHELAAYVRGLPNADARLDRLAAMGDYLSMDGFLCPGDEASRLISRFGFDHAEGTPQASMFLDQLVTTIEREFGEWREENRPALHRVK
jgi:hypothetical protein